MIKKIVTFILLSLMLFACTVSNNDVGSPQPGSGEKSSKHEIICAYYPYHPRWHHNPNDFFWIGDKTNQTPLLQINENAKELKDKKIIFRTNSKNTYYANRPADTTRGQSYPDFVWQKAIDFDFECMKNAGITVVNVHIGRKAYEDYRKQGKYFDKKLFDAINMYAKKHGLKWTPTLEYEQVQAGVEEVKKFTHEVVKKNYSHLFTHNGGKVFLWTFYPHISANSIANSIHELRSSTKKNISIILDHQGGPGDNRTSPYQNGGSATAGFSPTPLFTVKDQLPGIGKQIVTGYYSWVALGWASGGFPKTAPEIEPKVIKKFITACNSAKSIPVISVTPSFIDEPRNRPEEYNPQRKIKKWSDQLNNTVGLKEAKESNAWLYIQAYDEWGEGTTLAPTEKDKFAYLAMLRERLVAHQWISGPEIFDFNKIVIPDIYKKNGNGKYDLSQFIDQKVPNKLNPGQSFQVTIRMKNIGDTAWNRNQSYKLGFISPKGDKMFGTNKLEMNSASIPPGEIATFTANLKAPTTPGRHPFQWQMLQEGKAWFGAATTRVEINVGGKKVNNAQFISQQVPDKLTPGQSFTIKIKIKNNGTTIWTKSQHYRLGFISPKDGKPFETNRLEMSSSTVPPGGIATFTATLKAPANEGSYPFQWQMVQEGKEWFGAMSQRVNISVGSIIIPKNNAAFVSQNVPNRLQPGQAFNVEIRMKNTGNTAWTKNRFYRLGFASPRGGKTFEHNRLELTGSSVPPGGLAIFRGTLKAPTGAGNYSFQWQMLQEGKEWFGSMSQMVNISVGSIVILKNNAQFAGQNLPTSLSPGQKFNAEIRMKNTGNTTWVKGQLYRLGFNSPQDGKTFGTHRIDMVNSSVAPGGIATFKATLSAPNGAGSYPFQWQMLQEGKEWFGSMSPKLNINVSTIDEILPAVFEAEGRKMGHMTGKKIGGGWRVTVKDKHHTYMSYGPYVQNLPKKNLTADFYLRVDNNTADNAEICVIDVCTNIGNKVLARKTIRRKDFKRAMKYQRFSLNFKNIGGKLEFRVYYIWNSMLDFDKVIVK